MTENNTTMNNQAVAFKHFTLNDIIEYLEKRNPDEEMVYSLTFDALSRVGEIKLIARKEKTTVSKNLSTINLIVSDAVKKSVAFFKIDAAVIPVCEMAMGIIFGEVKHIQRCADIPANYLTTKDLLNAYKKAKETTELSKKILLTPVWEGYVFNINYQESVRIADYISELQFVFDKHGEIWSNLRLYMQSGTSLVPLTQEVLDSVFNTQSPNQESNNESNNKHMPNIKDLGMHKPAKKDKYPSIHVSFFDNSIPVLEIVDDKGTGKVIVQHLLDKNIVSSLRYFDETGKVTKVINVTLS